MKLCPQCEFIYEDDQSLCDMDGSALVYDPVPSFCGETILSRSPEVHDTVEIPATVSSVLPVSQPATSHFRKTAFAALAAIVLVTLLFVVYYSRTRQPRSGQANQASNQNPVLSPDLFNQVMATTQEASDLVAAPAEPDMSPTDQSLAESPDLTTSSTSSPSLSSEAPPGRGRLSNPVSAGGAGSRPVVVWLANGASIKADEAWEKKEGIWYRQGGMVTFLKRGRVRSIQRLATPNQSSVAIKAEQQNRKPANAVAQNHTPENTNPQSQPRPGTEINSGGQNGKPENTIAQNRPIAKPELASAKKDSKVTSFLKRTGRILKRPFQF